MMFRSAVLQHFKTSLKKRGAFLNVARRSSSIAETVSDDHELNGMDPMLTSYNTNNALQETCQTIGNPILTSFSTDLGLQHSGGRIAEFGCSGGSNSVEPVKAVLGSNSSNSMFEVILEDLPSNPWHQVTAVMEEHRDQFPKNVHFLLAGISFYEPVCAPESLDLAYSYVSVHFLSDSPPLADHLIYHESQSEQTKKLWAEQAASDWERLLMLRAREMKSGGKLLLSTMGRDDSGYSWKIFSGAVWEAMHKSEALSPDELAVLRIPTSLRSEEEVLAPFQGNSLLSNVFSVDDCQFAFTEVPGEEKEAPGLAALYRRRIESVWGGVLIHQLVDNGREPKDATRAMKKVWDEFERMAEQDPSLGWLFMQCYYLQLTKL